MTNGKPGDREECLEGVSSEAARDNGVASHIVHYFSANPIQGLMKA